MCNILFELELVHLMQRIHTLYNELKLGLYKLHAFNLFSVMLELLTQRKAVEKTGTLHHVLKKGGVLSDPEKLMAKAKQVSSFLALIL